FLHYFAQKPIVLPQSTLDLFRGAHDQVQRESPLERPKDTNGLRVTVAGRHNHQQIDVALVVRRPVGIRAEEDDLLRLEALGDLAREAPDGRERNVRRLVAVRLDVRAGGALWFRHGFILATASGTHPPFSPGLRKTRGHTERNSPG